MMGGVQKTYKQEAISGGYDSINTKNSSMGDQPHLSYHEVKLENLCEKNCPKSPSVASIPTAVVQPAPAQTTVDRKNQTLKQRINSLVIKTLAENLEKDKHSMGSLQSQQNTQQNGNSTVVSFIIIIFILELLKYSLKF